MKKILALVLALMLVLSTSMVAFAAGSGDTAGSVNVAIEKADEIVGDPNDVDSGATFLIDIDLVDVTFTYSFGAYSTSTHQYANSGWKENKTSADITLSNHSNTSLKVGAKFTDGTTNTTKTEDGVTATITTPGPISIASAVGESAAPTGKVNVTIAGEPTRSSNWKLATLTLTIDGTDSRA